MAVFPHWWFNKFHLQKFKKTAFSNMYWKPTELTLYVLFLHRSAVERLIGDDDRGGHSSKTYCTYFVLTEQSKSFITFLPIVTKYRGNASMFVLDRYLR